MWARKVRKEVNNTRTESHSLDSLQDTLEIHNFFSVTLDNQLAFFVPDFHNQNKLISIVPITVSG
jgi:hypothetical protein